MRGFKFIIGGLIGGAAIAGLSGCATISQDECLAGNWADIGYRDGVNGTSQTRIADYANTCSKYGAQIDRDTYLKSYNAGLALYCVPDNGYEVGRSGSSYKNVCAAPEFAGFRDAYYEGRAQYEEEQERLRILEAEHDRIIEAIEYTEHEIQSVRRRIDNPETAQGERDRLRRKLRRLQDRIRYQKEDHRAFDRANDLSTCY